MKMVPTSDGPLQLTSLNHISIVCRCVVDSLNFYQNVLGFIPIRRPGSLNFTGAWLFSSYGIGIHLLQSEDPESMPKKSRINPRDNHISFQCESMEDVARRLDAMGIPFVKQTVEEGGVFVNQLFFHDPDGFMIEICNCENLPVISLSGEPIMVCKRATAAIQHEQQQQVVVQQASSVQTPFASPITANEEAWPMVI